MHDKIGKYGGDPRRSRSWATRPARRSSPTSRPIRSSSAAHDLALDDLACVAPLDTEGFDVTRQGQFGTPLYLDAFGTDPQVWADASAIDHVARRRGHPAASARAARHAARDNGELEAYANALTAAGVPVTIVDARGLSHNEVNSQIGAPGDTVMTPAVTAFLAGCFSTSRQQRHALTALHCAVSSGQRNSRDNEGWIGTMRPVFGARTRAGWAAGTVTHHRR